MTRVLLAIAALAAVVVPLRHRRAREPEPDGSEIVGMPTTWPMPEGTSFTFTASGDGTGPAVWLDTVNRHGGPGWYVEFAPTSRN